MEDQQPPRPRPHLVASRFGTAVHSGPYRVDRNRIAAFAAATNDSDAAARTGERSSFAFAVVPPFPLIAEQAVRIVTDPRAANFLHGSHRLKQIRRLRPGDEVSSSCTVVGLYPSPIGAVMVTRILSSDADGASVSEQWCATIVRSHDCPVSLGQTFPDFAPVAPTRKWGLVTQHFDDDQSRRYAEASGDFAPIHLDPASAAAAGLPGVIIHGMCTMAFAAVAVTQALCPEQPEALGSLSCRFSAPAFPSTDLLTSVALSEDGQNASFSSTVEGRTVLSRGTAALAQS